MGTVVRALVQENSTRQRFQQDKTPSKPNKSWRETAPNCKCGSVGVRGRDTHKSGKEKGGGLIAALTWVFQTVSNRKRSKVQVDGSAVNSSGVGGVAVWGGQEWPQKKSRRAPGQGGRKYREKTKMGDAFPPRKEEGSRC